MTPNMILAAAAVGIILLLSCVVSWYLVQTLKQTRATALALEQFLTGTRPRIESAADQLRSVMSRADHILAAAEEGGAAVSTILGAAGQAVAGWKAGAQAISTLSTLVAGAVQAWASLSKPRGAPSPAPAGGTSHE